MTTPEPIGIAAVLNDIMRRFEAAGNNLSGGAANAVCAGRESKPLEPGSTSRSRLTLREDSAPPAHVIPVSDDKESGGVPISPEAGCDNNLPVPALADQEPSLVGGMACEARESVARYRPVGVGSRGGQSLPSSLNDWLQQESHQIK